MDPYEIEELTDGELREALAAWIVTIPSQELRARIFSPKPVIVGNVWEAYGGGLFRSLGVGLLVQASAVAMLFLAFRSPMVQDVMKKPLDRMILVAYRPKVTSAETRTGGGGGGGQKALKPASRGEAPQFAPKPFMPPAMAVVKPLLPVTPTISANAPQIEADAYGDPLSELSNNSGGQGTNGIGSGKGGGVGGGTGDGLEDGTGGGFGSGLFTVGGDVSSPMLILKVEPEYSEAARKAKYSGKVLLSVIVDEYGIPREIHVMRPLGLGLDEKAIEAVARWRFRPGLRNGKAVRVLATVEVSFRLL